MSLITHLFSSLCIIYLHVGPGRSEDGHGHLRAPASRCDCGVDFGVRHGTASSPILNLTFIITLTLRVTDDWYHYYRVVYGAHGHVLLHALLHAAENVKLVRCRDHIARRWNSS